MVSFSTIFCVTSLASATIGYASNLGANTNNNLRRRELFDSAGESFFLPWLLTGVENNENEPETSPTPSGLAETRRDKSRTNTDFLGNPFEFLSKPNETEESKPNSNPASSTPTQTQMNTDETSKDTFKIIPAMAMYNFWGSRV
mmetsp:Transcript_3577/g.5553  ORF Transcript_3577/g.5553 Transcript_3577/m.5553 type:complete len:144 (+) Transcript_3577:122-553(+)